jgi:guanylate kinase
MKGMRVLEAKYHRALSAVARTRQLDTYGHQNIVYALEQATHHVPLPHTRLIVLSGLSGVGKKTVGRELTRLGRSKMRNVFARPMRPYETPEDGVFVSEEQFHAWDKADLFITTAITNGSHHGLLRRDFLDAMEIDASLHWTDKSVHSMKLLLPFLQHTHLYYLLPPSFEEIARRLEKREQNNPDIDERAIEQRFEHELDDLCLSAELPYDYIVVDDIDRVVPLIVGDSPPVVR